ncbi:glycerate kinase type-2 family protein [Roseimaritima ulvae]|uniref:Hydroxypyruvate reductase n=1 Tax=Roseimaritima ulvae TaxID=980254 RepID=A0A5B9QRP3_9BACT|nr:DUF4147 domain-containing protein [Roseimaritima ulvae]QEG40622.1 Putative hydroxypyruvate reductase [Roseimaritima ulvae]
MSLRQQTLQIWNAGVDAVRADRLISEQVRFHNAAVEIQDERFPVPAGGHVEVVGAGKAATAMASGIAQAFVQREQFDASLAGWVNVPDQTQQDVEGFHVHVGRPAGVNEPTQEAISGTQAILDRVAQLQPQDVCIALISGGGSALLTAPVTGVTLEEKLAAIRMLSGGGANIEQLNTVRKHLSRVKGGGLANACRAGTLLTLVVSDVLGDPLDLIASGPTVHDPSTAADALEILQQFDPQRSLPASIYTHLQHHAAAPADNFPAQTHTFVLGNNATAVDEAGIVAERLGFNHAMHCSRSSEGAAEEVGRHLADMAISMLRDAETPHQHPGPNCLITGGEPTVHLAPPEIRGRGGRNQQLVLAAMQRLLERDDFSAADRRRVVILSGGTDGEDGPTDAAGALLDAEVWDAFATQNLDIEDYLRRNDAYTFFQQTGGLVTTGPTHTNVCDLRVVTLQDA